MEPAQSVVVRRAESLNDCNRLQLSVIARTAPAHALLCLCALYEGRPAVTL